jgi:hypothetical protein
MEETANYVTYYQNPFYDEVLIFLLDQPVPPKQRKGKLQNRNFEALIKNDLSQSQNENWPYLERVMVVFSVTGPIDYLDNVDIDNVAKSILDICKGILFKDDRQVYSLIAEKHIQPTQPAFVLALRKMKEGEFADFVPAFYSGNPEHWKEDRILKFGNSAGL